MSSQSNVGPTRALAELVAGQATDAIPAWALHEAKRTLINVLAVGLSGTREVPSRALTNWVRAQGGAERATAFGGLRTSPSRAALLNGYLAHIEDYDDTHIPTILHPSAPVWPAVLAAAEDRGLGGRETLAAFALGMEVACRVAMSVYPWHYEQGWHITGTAGIFGGAAGAGRALGLDPVRLTHAFGLAGTHASGLREAMGSHTKAMHPARAASTGLESAELAEAGLTGPDDLIGGRRGFWAIHSHEGHSEEQLLGDWGERWELAQNGLKPYANGVVAHPLQDAVIQLRNEHGLKPEQVACLAFRVNPLVVELMGRSEPRTGFDGKFSYRHCVAAGLVDGAGRGAQFTDDRVVAPEIVRVRSLITEIIDPAIAEDATHLTITLTDGRTLEKHVEHATGSPENPMSDSVLEEKFRASATTVLTEDQAERLLSAAWTLDEAPSVDELMRLTVTAGVAAG